IRLDDSEDVAGRILRVGEPAYPRDRHFRNADFSAALLYFLYYSVQRFHGDRVYSPGALPFTRTGNAAIDSGLLVITGRDQPVLYRAAFEFVKLPAENVAVKWLHCFRIIGVNLK